MRARMDHCLLRQITARVLRHAISTMMATLDLFVGSRSVPGLYGLSPNQLLLENDGHGNFRDVTDQRMKRLKKIGMVTDACWIDYDRDGDKDLILAGEWMKVSVLNNNKGMFSDVNPSCRAWTRHQDGGIAFIPPT